MTTISGMNYFWAIIACVLLAESRPHKKTEALYSTFHSRPDLRAPILHIYEKNADLVQPGYFFLTPYGGSLAQQTAYIYDNDGELVWSGFGAVGPRTSQNLHVCGYIPHLCLFQGEQQSNGWSRGHGVILDVSYRVAASVEAGGSDGMLADMHVLKMIDGGESAIISTYGPRRWDMTALGHESGVGWILESGFQEIDVMTGALLFEWASLDHIPPEEGLVAPSSSRTGRGTGRSSDDPWDYFHLNSVDKMSDGDYIVSASHTSTIYRVEGKTGEIVWRVEGVGSGGGGYAKLDGLEFSFPQDVRILHEADDETTLSIFDNAANQPGDSSAGRHASGKIIQLNHTDHTARLLRSYPSPRRKLGSSQGGSMQPLDPGGVSTSLDAELPLPGNAIICWGDVGSFSEVDAETGEVALDAGFDNRLDAMLYRVYKSNWTARPLTLPALWTYSLNGSETGSSSMTGYVSWNGATEVRTWKLHGSADGSNGPWIIVDEVSKKGFETAFRVDGYYGRTYAEALDEEGNVLGSSKVTETFVFGAYFDSAEPQFPENRSRRAWRL
ncbi:ASST-domain-containing protein [Coniochaeta sp. 2T2.1]|nr:ASST-domain-containing protein [Coniochaeta sp. 2T2.1]